VKKIRSISNKDINAWKEYTNNPKDVFDKDRDYKKTEKKIRYKFDLHGFTLTEANQKVKELLIDCYEKKYSELLLITGKGLHSNTDKDVFKSNELSKLRFSIPEYINSELELKKKIISIVSAASEDGGEGALLIRLRRL
jgi:DNA-nicking Smr family endonuclease